MSKLFKLMACSAVLCMAGPSFAGEVKASKGGQYIQGSDSAPLQGASECAYSGLNDDYYIYDDPNAPRTQSYGQLVRGPDGIDPSQGGTPGMFCNPSSGSNSGE